jgi:hypothetical protein
MLIQHYGRGMMTTNLQKKIKEVATTNKNISVTPHSTTPIHPTVRTAAAMLSNHFNLDINNGASISAISDNNDGFT